MNSSGLVCTAVVELSSTEALLALTPLTSCHAVDLNGAESVEAVHEGDADMDFGDLTVWVSLIEISLNCRPVALSKSPSVATTSVYRRPETAALWLPDVEA